SVMGATGSGKTTFINVASGSDLRVGMGLESCTNEVQTSQSFMLDGKRVVLVDTPGFDDTTKSDTDVLKMIAAYLQTIYEHGTRLAGVIYMHRISDFRMGGTSKRNFKIFRELCGESSLKNVIIVTNMWSEVKREIGEAREAELASKDKFFKPVLEKGARMLRHDGTLESAHTTLRYLINSQAATLRIQQEIVNEHKPIEKTAAGAEIRRALDEQADHHKEEIRSLKAEMEVAMRAKDEETRAELQEELEKKQQECLRIEQNAQHMAAEFTAERARLEALILRMEAEQQKQLQTQEEAAAAKKVEEETQSRLVELQELAKHREEEQRKTAEQEVARARKELEEAHAKAEREAAAAKEAQELERARLLEEQKKREEEHRRQTEEELARLRQLVAQSEEQSASLAEQARQKEVTEKKSQQLEEELAKARERAREAKLDYERRLTDIEEQSSLERGLPLPGVLLPNLPFVVWKAAMTWWGTTKMKK
ncbi:P-loop containing nucleoside triphosphate hydrolase protein, partial [Suillus discolor]